jgi:hypothetical protein
MIKKAQDLRTIQNSNFKLLELANQIKNQQRLNLVADLMSKLTGRPELKFLNLT